jgi:hypothetical protein
MAKSRLEIDPQEQERIFQDIGLAMQVGREVTLQLFLFETDEFSKVTGIPLSINQQRGMLKVGLEDDDYEWVHFNDIVGVD